MLRALLLAATLAAGSGAALAQTAPIAATPAVAPSRYAALAKDGDFVVRDFKFRSGETLPELKMHYLTLGTPKRDAAGNIVNAVMVLHGTSGSGRQFLQPQFADELYGPGQPLDLAKTYVILPDNIGHGASSKPSDGLKMRFPSYDYDDMVEAQRRLLVDGLGVKKLRLLMGTSMGCMHGFVWGEANPGFVQAMMPMACLPAPIAGQNRMWRKLAMDAIKADPAWNGGNYTAPPAQGMRTAATLLAIVGGNPLALAKQLPTREAVDKSLEGRIERDNASRDANDLIYQINSSRNYDPSKGLEKMTMPVAWINSSDDFINPPGLGIAEPAAKRLPNGTYRLIEGTPETKGHGTHTWAKFWKADLIELLKRSEK
ncbi:alpha/beta fold hydrolase [Sphingoaurantiacus capsulatus]|uniref:Alpha/beta fold hydrolase n=1 Tax=Sphingoaurantiacus capsulatus TaxID=1771310 RepID=A0ABV7XE22_9SPHN